MLRSISISDDADLFLRTYERRLARQGKSRRFVGRVALELFDVIFRQLPGGALRNHPVYVGTDPYFADHSIYSFQDSLVAGQYSSSGDHVILLSLEFVEQPSEETAARISAA
jgi:hypothetical protein